MRSLCVIFLLLSSIAAHAGEGNHIAVHGFDKMSCGDWRASRYDSTVRGQYVAWMRGIVTGYNYANPEEQVAALQMPDDAALAFYVDGYCRDRPLTPFVGAAFALIDELRGKAPQITHVAPRDDLFQDWLHQQSPDMQSLDANVQHKIYNKESTLRSK